MTLEAERYWPADGPPGAAEAWARWEPTVHAQEDVDFDFDASWAERGIKPSRVRIMGDVYRLPAEPPAKLILFKARNRNNPDREVGEHEVIDLLATMLGRASVDQLLDKGIGPRQLTDVLSYCMRNVGKDRPQGEGNAPNAGAQPPESTG